MDLTKPAPAAGVSWSQAPRITVPYRLPLAGQIRRPQGAKEWLFAIKVGVAVLGMVVVVPASLISFGEYALAAVFVVACASLIVTTRWVITSTRIEWDGSVVRMRGAGSNRIIGRAGQGRIIRAELAAPTLGGLSLGSAASIGTLQFWLDADGKAIGRVPEQQWDAELLAKVAEEARLPVTDLGTLTFAELAEQVPTLDSRFGNVMLSGEAESTDVPAWLAVLAIVGVIAALGALVYLTR